MTPRPILATASSVFLALMAPVAIGTAHAAAPNGWIDVTTASRVAGWAKDPDYSGPIYVHIYVDGQFVKQVLANGYRGDGNIGYHGFDTGLSPYGAGSHVVRAYAIGVNTAGQPDQVSPELSGSPKTFTGQGSQPPAGWLDVARADVIAGWVKDPDSAGPISVHIFVDGVDVKTVAANTYRADVGAHGFGWTPPVLGAGSHQVRAYGIGVNSAGQPDQMNAELSGSPKTFTVQGSQPPTGWLDVARADVIAGWVKDPDSAGPISVHILVDGVDVKTIAANTYRADVGAHGFGWTPPAFGAGSHQVRAYGIGVNSAGQPDQMNAELSGSPKTFTVQGSQPLGWQDGANGEFTDGWACDPASFAQPLRIAVYREGGVYVGDTTADRLRPDVASVCGGQAAHGFLFEYPPELRDGRTHTIYTYATDLGGKTNALLNGSPRSIVIAPEPDELYMTQPSVEDSEIDDRIIGDINPASETFLVRMANFGVDADQAQVSWGVGSKTAFWPALGTAASSYQRGPNDLAGTTAVQLRGKDVGIWMDSATVQLTKGDLLPITPAYWWWDSSRAPRPFAVPGGELSFSLALKIPTAYRAAGGDVYANAYFLFTDVTTSQAFWYGASLFDLRGNLGEQILCDCWTGGTKWPIVTGPLVPGGRFLHLGPGSATLQSTTWNDYRYFNFRVGEQELRQAITAVKQKFPSLAPMSDNPADYRLDNVAFNPELSMPPGSRAQLGLAVRNIKVGLYR